MMEYIVERELLTYRCVISKLIYSIELCLYPSKIYAKVILDNGFISEVYLMRLGMDTIDDLLLIMDEIPDNSKYIEKLYCELKSSDIVDSMLTDACKQNKEFIIRKITKKYPDIVLLSELGG